MPNLEDTFLTDLAHETTEGFKRAADGDLDQVSGLENIKNSLLRRLQVTPGSLVHRPNYGVGIKDFLNGVNSIDNQRTLALRVKEQFEQDFRVVEVLGLRVSSEDTRPEKVVIFIRVKLVGYGDQDLQFIPFGEVATNG